MEVKCWFSVLMTLVTMPLASVYMLLLGIGRDVAVATPSISAV